MQNMRKLGAIVAVTGFFALPLTAQAQGITGGAAQGAQQAARRQGLLAWQLEVWLEVLPAA